MAITIKYTCDYMGRRDTKKVTDNGAVTLHHPLPQTLSAMARRACLPSQSGNTAEAGDLTRTAHPCLWLITWDPSQPTATRPLAIQKDGTWYTYGWDLTKNICEVYGQHGYIRTNYTYSPYGQVTESGDVTQPFQWSSEYHDTELALVYYNYRHYNPVDGRWLGRDRIDAFNLYAYVSNTVYVKIDYLGLWVNPKGDKVEWCAQKGDTLASLPRRANPKASFKDWECMWPIEGTKDHGYPTLIQPGDVYDASNVLTTHTNELYIEMDIDLLSGHRENYGISKSWLLREKSLSVFTAIRDKSGEGRYPISRMVVGGHGSGKGTCRGVTKLESGDPFTGDKIPHYAGLDIDENLTIGLRQPYDFTAKQKRKGPPRCWFSKNSKVIFPGCSTMMLADQFAKLVLRKGAKAQGTRLSIKHSISGYLHKDTPPTKVYTEASIYYDFFQVRLVTFEDAENCPFYAIYEGKL